MTAHMIFEIVLLTLVFFVVGCIIGCLARRSFGSKSVTREPAAGSSEPAPAAKAPGKSKSAKPKAAEKEPVQAKPRGLKQARASGADDLKEISGVGPALEKKLNELGYYHFDQIAKWSRQNVAWVDDHLNFRGRIDRDDWVAQAKRLSRDK